MAGGTLESLHTGEKIIIAGLLVQILFFGLFMLVAILFDVAVHRVPTPRAKDAGIPWHKHLNALYLASVLILIRSIFRVVEYIQGNDGFLISHEYFLYIFDAVLMLAVMVVFNFVHPSEVNALLKGGQAMRGWKLGKVEGGVGHGMTRLDGYSGSESA
jgi:uncharacterized membrane protein YhaH (DUF805 family)